MYHKNAIKNRETIAARTQKRPRLTRSDQSTIAQIVADSHPEGMGHQMDIESISHPNNDRLFSAQLKPDQVETRGMTVVLAAAGYA